ncbi:hypothetical protein J2752_000997 [Halarchaeum rubridurum]|uniref:DUF7981 domain-containing protein n=1 Tax=Halarchaeum rubridurum TaxID=489911 RepID=A0A830FJS5_9EURY|nr:hypothetical protein [Halarchaeum rubridurum]MBP1954116.1 hypothetical protein [Halarchaeum rubridurum]GGM57442.1 hypothetical protein GCM10009017_04540 [Halarchaeum rubridurum]
MGLADTAAWGGVAALAFLVVAVAYRTFAAGGPSLPVLLALAVVVGSAGAVGARVAERRPR